MHEDRLIDYLELPSKDLAATRRFFGKVFGWHFTDYGEEYTAFNSTAMQGGFYLNDKVSLTATGGALVIFYCRNLEEVKQQIEQADGKIIKPIFEFPGGKRFHFTEPGGSEFAVWSDQ
ncbi:VOC family protein [Alteromonas pelagimontana]|uniref:VOC family protein n=1 Tax=Alteromonas pelagimontana TaxID=1858656 RepID=A0A6M4MFK3_9ALTE|nr:VOC family protein [Alteromonas pelagimontana]QJR80956.1 VOC family protein [Alteromonas pelagimontana]